MCLNGRKRSRARFIRVSAIAMSTGEIVKKVNKRLYQNKKSIKSTFQNAEEQINGAFMSLEVPILEIIAVTQVPMFCPKQRNRRTECDDALVDSA